MGVFVDAQERIYATGAQLRAVCVDAQGNILAEYRQPRGKSPLKAWISFR